MVKKESPTRFKLTEAMYFLDSMRGNYDHSMKFRFYLSAFLASARSVLDYMHREYCKKPGYSPWEKKYLGKIYDGKFVDSDIEFLNQKRVDNIHIKNVSTKGTYQRKVWFKPSIDEIKELRKQGKLVPQQEMFQGSDELVRRFFPDKQDVDILDYCANVLQKISNLVCECEKQFKTSN